jgi:Regulator of chromosome condensation (RCC1) repeat
VWAWGANYYGQLGDGTTINRPTAVQVQNLSGITSIGAGYNHNLALENDGTAWAWGYNFGGQLGVDGTTFSSSTPVQVQNLSGAKAIAGGMDHSLAEVPPATLLTIRKILEHPDQNQFRRFNIMLDGVVVAEHINAGDTVQRVSPGIHTVSEAGGTGTLLSDFTTEISGDCAADGTVNLALGDKKTCTITNYDHLGGCTMIGSRCCEPGEGVQGCRLCVAPPRECP